MVAVVAVVAAAVLRCSHSALRHYYRGHFRPMGTGTEARRMANSKWLCSDRFRVAATIVVDKHRPPCLVNRAWMDRCPGLLADCPAGMVASDILADRWRLLAATCRMDTGIRVRVSSDEAELALLSEWNKLDKWSLVARWVD